MSADDRRSADAHRTPEASRSRVTAALLPKFVSHRERDVATIRTALERGDFESIATLGHNMRGNGTAYGFPEVSAIGERLEIAANTKNARGVGEELSLLEAWLARSPLRDS